jgi:hypothetical protein
MQEAKPQMRLKAIIELAKEIHLACSVIFTNISCAKIILGK